MTAFAEQWSWTMAQSGFRHSGGPWAENIAWWGAPWMSAEEAALGFHEMWVASGGHYRNMTNPRWSAVGIGLYHDESGWYGTHVFRD